MSGPSDGLLLARWTLGNSSIYVRSGERKLLLLGPCMTSISAVELLCSYSPYTSSGVADLNLLSHSVQLVQSLFHSGHSLVGIKV